MADPVAGAVVTEPATTAQRGPAGGRYGDLLRFALVGGTNTLVTLGLFVLLQRWVPAGVAYTAVFALGLAYTTVMTARVVFGAGLTWRTGGAFVGWYLVVYAVGLGVVHLLGAVWQPSLWTAAVTVAVTAPLNFLGGRLLFTSGGRDAHA